MQLMTEDDGADIAPVAGLDNSDIKTIDLVKFLLDRGPRKDLDDLCRVDHVIEVFLPSSCFISLILWEVLFRDLKSNLSLAWLWHSSSHPSTISLCRHSVNSTLPHLSRL
jgi:protein-histidine N-methyltransferase